MAFSFKVSTAGGRSHLLVEDFFKPGPFLGNAIIRDSSIKMMHNFTNISFGNPLRLIFNLTIVFWFVVFILERDDFRVHENVLIQSNPDILSRLRIN